MSSRTHNFKTDHEGLRLEQMSDSTIYPAIVQSVNPETQTMTVEIERLDRRIVSNVPINQMLTLHGSGIRMMPTPKGTIALLYNNTGADGSFYHIGYLLRKNDSQNITSDKQNTKQSKLILQQYLNPGEIQIMSISGSEIFLDDAGMILIKSGTGNFIRLSEFSQSIEMFSNDLDIQVENININAGRVKRVLAEDTANDIIPKVQREVTNEGEDNETITTHTEFRVDIGTQYDIDTGVPTVNKNEDTNLDQAPTTGTLAFASKVFNQEGEAEKLLQNIDTIINFLLKLPSKMHMGIDDLGNFYIVNEKTDSYFKFRTNLSTSEDDTTQLDFVTSGTAFSCNKEKCTIINRDKNDQLMFGKDTDGNTQFSARTGDNIISCSNQEGLSLKDPSGSEIGFTDEGDIIIKHSSGRCLQLDENGLTVNMMGATVAILSRETSIIGNLGLGGTTDDGVLPATVTAAQFDLHVHPGPAATPTPTWSNQVSSGTLQLSGLKASL